MRKTIALALTAGLIIATPASPATAKKKAKAVKTELFLHGHSHFGEVDGIDWFANGAPPMKLSADEPTEDYPRSMNLGNPALNTNCTGLPLGFPTWVGNISGTVKGDVTLTASFVSPGAPLTARLWLDIPVFSCNESYIPPNVEVVADVPAGQSTVEIVFEDVNAKADSLIMIELLAGGIRGPSGRVLYDSPDAPSVLSFKCIPAKGKSCV